jgi:hypothetical protein
MEMMEVKRQPMVGCRTGARAERTNNTRTVRVDPMRLQLSTIPVNLPDQRNTLTLV